MVCERLRQRFPTIIPNKEKELVRFLYAVRHVERHPASETRRGRPGRWAREVLIEAASQLRGILQRETLGRVSVSSFIGQYLQVLYFPHDVLKALASGDINLQEAAQLARITAGRLGCSPAAALAQRSELLRSHLTVQGSQTRLRAHVKEVLGESSFPEINSEGMASAVAVADELLEIDPSETRHLFWEEMKRIFFAMREIKPEDIDDETLDEFLGAIDQISAILYRIEKRREARTRQRQKKRHFEAFPKK
jgi:hypothetical protein